MKKEKLIINIASSGIEKSMVEDIENTIISVSTWINKEIDSGKVPNPEMIKALAELVSARAQLFTVGL